MTAGGGQPGRRVVLARHGRVDLPSRCFGGAAAFRDFLAAYDRAPLDPAHPPPSDLAALAREAVVVMASALPRSRASAAWLVPDRTVRSVSLFDEAPVPALELPLRLPMVAWTALARAAWLAGAGGCESAAAVRARAVHACGVLEEATAAGPVFLAGHGWMNRLLTASLVRRGWRVAGASGHGPWCHRLLTRAP